MGLIIFQKFPTMETVICVVVVYPFAYQWNWGGRGALIFWSITYHKSGIFFYCPEPYPDKLFSKKTFSPVISYLLLLQLTANAGWKFNKSITTICFCYLYYIFRKKKSTFNINVTRKTSLSHENLVFLSQVSGAKSNM